MAYVSAKHMLLQAQAGGYAVGAFNAENMETVQAIVSAAEHLGMPVMVQTTPGSIRYAGIHQFAAMVKAEAERASVDVCLHLDHGTDFQMCMDCIKAGYTSVMIDCSRKPFAENIRLTRQVVEASHAVHVSVEAELGTLGGKEDDLSGDGTIYTDPEDAAFFAEQTGVDSLAIAIGTAHGVYKDTPILDMERIRLIREKTDVPLVLHGSSGLSDACIQNCVRLGICKVNFATELRIAFTNTVKKCIMENSSIIDPKKFLEPARDAVRDQVIRRMRVLNT